MNPFLHRLFVVLLLSSFGLSACQGYGPMSPLRVVESVLGDSSRAAAPSPAASASAAGRGAGAPPIAPTAAPPAAPTPPAVAQLGVVAAATTTDSSPTMPVALAIPAVNLQAQVTPMGWEPVLLGDDVTTRWVVPEPTLGWAVNSAGAGENGNLIIVGHQALGAALFRPLALGEVAVGQDVLLQAADGAVHLYRVAEVSAPIPAIGATAGEQAAAAAYLAPTGGPRLTLVSGWPADTTTHRLFVVADYVGPQP